MGPEAASVSLMVMEVLLSKPGRRSFPPLLGLEE